MKTFTIYAQRLGSGGKHFPWCSTGCHKLNLYACALYYVHAFTRAVAYVFALLIMTQIKAKPNTRNQQNYGESLYRQLGRI